MGNSAVILERFGFEGVFVREQPDPPAPATGELLIRMAAAPVNPADLNIIEGKYGELPSLPAILGNEGAGYVEAVGENVAGFAPGDLVGILRRGTWASRIVVPAMDVFPIPSKTDPLLAAMLGVNPPTALLLLERFAQLSPGDWIAQNAANSAVGRSVIRIARAMGIRTLNVVRRPELIEELLALGGDCVVTEETDLRREAATLTRGASVRLALNAVGGASALNLANALAPEGILVTYGAMGRQPLKIPNGLLIFKDLRFRGFWLTRWKSSAQPEERTAIYHRLAEMAAKGILDLAIQETYPLQNALAAITAATSEKRRGKILLRFEA